MYINTGTWSGSTTQVTVVDCKPGWSGKSSSPTTTNIHQKIAQTADVRLVRNLKTIASKKFWSNFDRFSQQITYQIHTRIHYVCITHVLWTRPKNPHSKNLNLVGYVRYSGLCQPMQMSSVTRHIFYFLKLSKLTVQSRNFTQMCRNMSTRLLSSEQFDTISYTDNTKGKAEVPAAEVRHRKTKKQKFFFLKKNAYPSRNEALIGGGSVPYFDEQKWDSYKPYLP